MKRCPFEGSHRKGMDLQKRAVLIITTPLGLKYNKDDKAELSKFY
jgi:hypothetical protein